MEDDAHIGHTSSMATHFNASFLFDDDDDNEDIATHSSHLLHSLLHSNTTDHLSGCYVHHNCSDGKLIPLWRPAPQEISSPLRAIRSIIFILVMAYLFLGVSYISDKFLEAVHNVISHKRRLRVTAKSGAEEYIFVPIWNETVAHLTLAVVGSSAPEIMLTTVEVFVHNFSAGELGPATIVGAGAYNLFIVTAFCIASVKSGESKRIKDMGIFFVTGSAQIFAYVWLYLIISVISPGVIDVWEALLTLAFFPITVLISYLVNKQCFGLGVRMRKLGQRSAVTPNANNTPSGGLSDRLSDIAHRHGGSHGLPFNGFSNRLSNNGQISNGKQTDLDGGQIELANRQNATATDPNVEDDDRCEAEAERFHRMQRREHRYMELEGELRRKYPNKSSAEICELAELELVNELPKSVFFYRSQALRRWAGGGEIITRKKLRQTISKTLLAVPHADSQKADGPVTDPSKQVIFFDPPDYKVVEDVGTFKMNVIRDSPDLDNEISVRYRTEDGTARAGVDYRPVEGVLTFKRGEPSKQIPVEVIDDEIFNEDTVFYVRLFNPEIVRPPPTITSNVHSHVSLSSPPKQTLILGKNSRATVVKLDDDHGGMFHFESELVNFEESVGEAIVKVIRSCGAKGNVIVPVRLVPVTAIPNEQYEDPGKIEVHFDSRQSEAFVRFRVMDERKLGKQAKLEIILGEPKWSSEQDGSFSENKSKFGLPHLRSPSTATIVITESLKLKRIVEDIANMDVNDFVGTTSWLEQLKAAVTVSDSQAEENGFRAKWYDYLLHMVTFFWKILVALIPPTEWGHGWPASLGCLTFLAILVALIDDLAVQLGCTMGLRDELTAITLVSLGTSLPDLFASRQAAIREETADAAIGHISGAAAANVFFGIGLAWSVAAIKNTADGNKLMIKPGSLAFSVTLYFTFAVISMGILLLRRLPPVHGELGGPIFPKVITVLLLVGFWMTYVALSALDNYCIIMTF